MSLVQPYTDYRFKTMSLTIYQLLQITIERDASDLHLLVGSPPTLRINGELVPVQGGEILTNQTIETLLFPLINETQKDVLMKNWELDIGFEYEGKGRFRINVYKQSNTWAVALRLIPKRIRTIDEIGLPSIIGKLTEIKQGLVLVTGPTGHGKSTTLASFTNTINMNRAAHIVTIEDPIEYVYPKGKSLISQRELNLDTKSWDNALKSALREDPDVVLIGEMRDLTTIASALTIAETGHLVFATLHTNSAAQSIDRIIDVFPPVQQSQIRLQLASVLEAIISQRLIPTIEPGRTLAYEILFANAAVRAQIREDKTYMLDNLIQTSAEGGMVSLEACLTTLVREGKITSEIAFNYAANPNVLNKLLRIGT
jgi:twitching motility protein PilT